MKPWPLLLAATLTACQIHEEQPKPPSQHESKTWTEIKAESDQKARQSVIEHLRKQGKSQEDIDRIFAYIDLPYKEQIERQIDSKKKPSENMLTLLHYTHEHCNSELRTLNLDLYSHEAVIDIKREIFDCALDSRVAVTDFHTKNPYEKNLSQTNKELLNDSYAKWQAFMEEIMENQESPYIKSLSIEAKTSIKKATLSINTPHH